MSAPDTSTPRPPPGPPGAPIVPDPPVIPGGPGIPDPPAIPDAPVLPHSPGAPATPGGPGAPVTPGGGDSRSGGAEGAAAVPDPPGPPVEPPEPGATGNGHRPSEPIPGTPRPTRRVPRVVWLITALNAALLLWYSFLLPTYRAPDEPLHVDLAHLWAEEGTYPAWDDRDTGSGIQRSLRYVRFGSRSEHLTADEALPRADRPAIDDLEEPPRDTGINQLSQHPPLYYVVTGSAERVVEVFTGDPMGNFQLETWFYRLLSIVFVTPLPLAIWFVSRNLGLPDAVAVAACLVPLAIPQYLHIGASVNNDTLQLALIWALTPLVLRIADGDLGTRTTLVAGVMTGLGLLTKGLAAAMPVWVLAALLVAWKRGGFRNGFLPALRAGSLFGVTALAVGGWWWIRNLVLYDNIMPSRFNQLISVSEDPRDVNEFISTWASSTTTRFWGDFGWYDVRLSWLVVAVATAVCLVGMVVSLGRRDKVANSMWGNRALLAAPLLLLIGGQFGNGLRGYLSSGRMAGLQGRYWYGALAALAVVVALGLAKLTRGHWRGLPVVMLIAVAVMQVMAASSLLGFYWGPPDGSLGDRFDALLAWSPLPSGIMTFGAVLCVLVAAATAVQVVAVSLRAGDDDDDAPSSDASYRPAHMAPALTTR